VNHTALAENVRSHFGVPAAGGMTEVHARTDEFTGQFLIHRNFTSKLEKVMGSLSANAGRQEGNRLPDTLFYVKRFSEEKKIMWLCHIYFNWIPSGWGLVFLLMLLYLFYLFVIVFSD
jgi:hypothetical protein